jgi:hypothetical protein
VKIINNVLSDELYQECLNTIKLLIPHQVWCSSSLTWTPGLTQGIQGSCISTLIPENLKTKILDEIKHNLPPFDKTVVQFYVWQPMSAIAWHDDKVHNFGATIYLNEQWYINGGGIFLYQTKEQKDTGSMNALIPQKNTMVVNDNHEYHMVTPVSFNVPECRFTIQIWGH